jgi:5'-3' exonuclease
MIAIIDGDSLLYLSLPKKSNPNSTYESCKQELDNRINSLLGSVNATKYVICLTTGKCFRYKNWKYSTAYKLRRKGSLRPPVFYALQEYLKQNYVTYGHPALEADDLVCALHTEYQALDQECIICSMDKDVLEQKAGVHYNYGKNLFTEVTTDSAERFLYQQMLSGDVVDSINAISGIGKKTADKILSGDGEYSLLVLNEYRKRFSIHEAMTRFYETFNMVYMLKSFEEVKRETNVNLTLPELRDIERIEGKRESW